MLFFGDMLRSGLVCGRRCLLILEDCEQNVEDVSKSGTHAQVEAERGLKNVSRLHYSVFSISFLVMRCVAVLFRIT